MNSTLEQFLSKWPKATIRDQDLNLFFSHNPNKRYDSVKYSIRKQILVHLRRGLYLINLPNHPGNKDPYELAQAIYDPSYISLESALSYHGWIPEVVYTTTSVTSRRTKEFTTPIGTFSYAHTPTEFFYAEVERVGKDNDICLIAQPWKALADHLYVYKRKWKKLDDLSEDLRIEKQTLQQSDIASLEKIIESYRSKYVVHHLKNYMKELT